MYSIIHLSAPHCPEAIRLHCLAELKEVITPKLDVITVTQKEDTPAGHLALYENILAGLKEASGSHAFIAEHDCIYPAGYFDVDPVDKLSYSKSVIYLGRKGYFKRGNMPGPLSTLFGPVELIKSEIEGKLLELKTKGTVKETEPREYTVERSYSVPVIDIRHGANFTGDRPARKHFKTKKNLPEAAMVWDQIDARTQFLKAQADKTEDAFPDLTQGSVKFEIPQPESLKEFIAAHTPRVSVIIPTRTEPLLEWTIKNLRRTTNPEDVEILVVFDGLQKMDKSLIEKYDARLIPSPWKRPEGVGPCRNLGSVAATGEYLVFIDAHMDFKAGWLDKLLAPIEADDTTITCAKCAVLRPDQLKITNKQYHGAHIRLFGQHGGLAVEWGGKFKPGPIPCILGATYAMTAKRYADIGYPWQNALGWGTSEQTISMINWFCGGSNVLTDAVTGHVFRKDDEVPYDQREFILMGRLFNRLRLFDMLPLPEDLRSKMIYRSCNDRQLRKNYGKVQELLAHVDDSEIQAKFVRTWDEWLEAFPSTMEKEKPTPAERKRVAAAATSKHPDDLAAVGQDKRFI